MAKNDKDSFLNILKRFTGAVKELYGTVNNISSSWAKVDQASANFARSVGMAAEGMKALRNSSLELVQANRLAINFGVNAEKLIQLQNQYIQGIGRNVMQNNSGLENFAAMSRMLQDQGAVDMTSKLENFGLSMEEVGNRVGKMFAEASKKGLSFETYSKNFLTNIEIAQNYNFAEGLKGLENMARKASQIKLDLQQTATFANKVNTIEGAINVGAKLQVLGGTFSQFADPLGMLNESLNDMDALQDRLIKMMGNLGQFNKQTGEIEISAFNKRRISAASEAMGLSSSEMMKMINSKARRNEIENQLNDRPDLNQDMKDLIANIGIFKNGVAGVNIDGEFKRLTEISNQDQKTLIAQTQTQSDDIKEIAKTLRGWDDMRKGRIEQYKNAEAYSIGRVLGNVTKGIDKFIGETLNFALPLLATVGGIGKLGIGGFKMFTSPFKKEKGGLLDGPSHKEGGMPILGSNMEVEGGEFVVNKNATKKNLRLLNAINKDKYEEGGIIGGQNNSKFDSSDFMTFLIYKEMLKNRKGLSFADKRNIVLKQQANAAKWNKITSAINAKNFSLSQTFSKIPKLSKVTAGSLMTGGILSLLGLATSVMGMIDTSSRLKSGELQRGSKEHLKANTQNGISMGSGIGSAIGTFFPPFGSIVGAALGAGVGWGISAIGNIRQKENYNIKKAIGLLGLDLKGDYKRRELNSIKSVLRNDKKITYDEFLGFNNKLQQKLIDNNDYKMPMGRAYIKKAKGGLLDGPSHSEGGMPILGSNMEVEGGEFVVNKNATRKNLKLLNAINKGRYEEGGIIKPRVDDLPKPLSVTPTQSINNIQQKPMEIKPISLDISGTIKLDIPSIPQNIDITKELLKNPNFINSLTQLIEKQMIVNEKGGYVPSKGLK